MRVSKPTSPPDYLFLGALIILVVFGFVMLASASSDLAKDRFGDGYYYIKHQAINGFAIGILGFLAGFLVYYRRWERFAIGFLVVNIILLILVFTPLGVSVKGAARWLEIGSFSFQPGEVLKLTFLIYIAAWIINGKKRKKSFSEGLLPFISLVAVIAFILFKQPSTTTAALIFFTSTIMYFTAGARFSFLAIFFVLGVIGFSFVVYFTPYRFARIITYIKPESANSLAEGYHINQTLMAIGSGKIFGTGYGRSTTKLHYLPEPIGDSIFAVIGEELGFAGSLAFVFLFFFLVWRGFMIARQVLEMFGKTLVIGFTSIMALQSFVNIGAVSGLLPFTGVPLPFVSFGGTALAVFLTMGGIILNVSRHRKQ